MTTVTLSIDAMGGDQGVTTMVAASLAALERHSLLSVILVGDETAVKRELLAAGVPNHPRVRIKHASQIVTMEDSAANALRGKKDSSMRVAINLVKSGDADACVSAGNTGALLATAKFVLKTLPGIDRPALTAHIPGEDSTGFILDLGASLECSAENLYQYALMGTELVKAVHGVEKPRVGVLNVGSEDLKGVDAVREAAQLLTDSDLNYIGFIEGDNIYENVADVVVCNGFVGNVYLKSSEGVARYVINGLKAEFKANIWGKIIAMIARPVLKRFAARMNPDKHNGASMLGLNGVVVKSHGGANKVAFGTAIDHAVAEAIKNVPEKITNSLSESAGVGSASSPLVKKSNVA